MSAKRPSTVPIFLLALVVLSGALACAGDSTGNAEPAQAAGAAENPGTAEAAGTADGGEATTASSGEMPPLPDAAAEDGTLPRSYLGWELGQATPQTEKTTESGVLRDTVIHYDRLSDDPPTFRRAYVHDGTIYRIEWKSRDPSVSRERIREVLTERLGPPEDSKWGPKNADVWSDGVAEGKTTILVRRAKGSEWLEIAVLDSWQEADLI